EPLVVHDHVGLSSQGHGARYGPRVAIQHYQLAPIRRAEETPVGERQPVRPDRGHVDGPRDVHGPGVQHDYLGGPLDVGKDLIGGGVVDRPPWTTGQRDGPDHLQVIYGHHRRRAVLARRIADIERIQVAAGGIVGQPVRSWSNGDLAEQRLVRAAEDAYPSAAAIR